MAEDYAAKMSRKTQAELLLYVQNHAEYREEAVLAALDELEARGLRSAHDDAGLRAALLVGQQETERHETEVRQQTDALELERRRQRGEVPPAEAEPEGPALYSPGTITIFSVLFSMVAGGVLLALNLRALRRTGPALLVLLFVVVYLLGGAALAYWVRQHYGQVDNWMGTFFNLPAILMYNLYFWPRYIGPRAYQSRSWVGPLLVCGLLVLGLYLWAKQLLPTAPM